MFCWIKKKKKLNGQSKELLFELRLNEKSYPFSSDEEVVRYLSVMWNFTAYKKAGRMVSSVIQW